MGFTTKQLQEFISDQNLEASELVEILELTVTDIIRKFPNEIKEHQEYFIPEGCLPEEDDE
jgi:hypothetical protein